MSTMISVKNTLNAIPQGQSFSINEFFHLGLPNNIHQIFARLVKKGEIKRLVRGVFVKPKILPIIGESFPAPIEVVQSLAKQTGETIAEHGAEAALHLQLTTQVPLESVFYTTGKTRTLQYGKQIIRLQHVSPKIIAEKGTLLGTVIAAFWFLGKNNVTVATITQLQKNVSEEAFAKLLQNVAKMPVWIANCFQQFQQQASRAI